MGDYGSAIEFSYDRCRIGTASADNLAASTPRALFVIQYLNLLRDVLDNGEIRPDRTGVGTRSLFGRQFRCNLQDGFPLLTTKRVFFKGVVHELLWFLSGSTNVNALTKHNVHIWDEWADENGELGPIYGYQWRSWPNHRNNQESIDQITNLVKEIKENPYSRRHIVSAWNVADIDQMKLPPCHALFQFYVSADQHLSCHLYQRSADIFLGVPFNIASYALLTHLVAQVTDLTPGEFIHSFGDVHLYNNHVEQAEKQLNRTPKPLPTIDINSENRDILAFKFDDIKLENYCADPVIPAPIAI